MTLALTDQKKTKQKQIKWKKGKLQQLVNQGLITSVGSFQTYIYIWHFEYCIAFGQKKHCKKHMPILKEKSVVP